jgi:hypothetical protein
MTTVERIIDALSSRGGFDGWWDDMDSDIQQEIVKEITTIIDEAATAELTYLKWFHSYADFGPAEADVRTMLQAEYAATVAPVPAGYSWDDDDEEDDE